VGGGCNSGTTSNIFPHPVTDGVDEFYIDGTCNYLGGPAEVIVRDTYMQAHVVASQYGRGKLVMVTDNDFTDWVINNNDNRLLAMNTFLWLAVPTYVDIPWLSEEPGSGTVAGHSSVTATLTFDASALAVGEYDGMLAIEHSDPNQDSPALIPVHLSVTPYVPPTYTIYLPMLVNRQVVKSVSNLGMDTLGLTNQPLLIPGRPR